MESATGVLTICMEKPVILGRTQMEWFILADEKFQYHLSTTTSARLIPGRLQCPRWTVQVMKHCRSKTIILWCDIFLLPLLTNFLQLICTCSTLDEIDVRFWSLVICVSFFHSWFLLLSLMTQEITCIWNFWSNDNFEFVPCFLVRKSAVPFVQKCTIKSIQMVGTPLWLVVLFSQCVILHWRIVSLILFSHSSALFQKLLKQQRGQIPLRTSQDVYYIRKTK